MKIKTRPFEISKSEYVNISFNICMKKCWWSFPLCLTVGVYFLSDNRNLFLGIFSVIFAILFPVLIWVSCWKSATSLQNKTYFERRRYEFDNDFITGWLDDGSNSQTRYGVIVKVVKSKTHLLLFISDIMFFHLPFDAFESEEDLAAFQNLLKDKLQIPLPF